MAGRRPTDSRELRIIEKYTAAVGAAGEPEGGLRWIPLKEALSRKDLPIIVLLTSDEGCPPCEMLDKTLHLYADHLDKHYHLVRMDVFEHADMLEKLGVRGYPCIIFQKPGGGVIGSRVGYMDKLVFGKELEKMETVLKHNP